MEENKVSLLDVETIMLFVMAFVDDIMLFFLVGVAIPGIGIAMAAMIIFSHWAIGLVILIYLWKRTSGWMPKVILISFLILPLPLFWDIILAMITSSKIGKFVVEQAVIQGVALATGGAGEALEGVAVASEGAEAGAAGIEAAEAVAAGTEAAGGIAEGAEAAGGIAGAGEAATEAGAEAAEKGAELGGGASDELSSPEERSPMENLGDELNQPKEDRFPEGPEEAPKESAAEEEPSKAKKKIEKVFDVLDRTTSAPRQEDQDDEDGLAQAA